MKKGLLSTLFLGFLLVLAACGGNDGSSDTDQGEGNDAAKKTEATGNTLDISATNFEFNQPEYTVKSGEEVKIALTNDEGQHGVAIDEFDVNIQGDGEATFTPEEPGEYTIYCSVPCGEGHADMQSTLVVE